MIPPVLLGSCYPECQEAKKQLQIYKIYCLVFEIKASFLHLFPHLCIQYILHSESKLNFQKYSCMMPSRHGTSFSVMFPKHYSSCTNILFYLLIISHRAWIFHQGLASFTLVLFFTPPDSFSSPVTSRGNAGSSVSPISHLNCYFGIVLWYSWN